MPPNVAAPVTLGKPVLFRPVIAPLGAALKLR